MRNENREATCLHGHGKQELAIIFESVMTQLRLLRVHVVSSEARTVATALVESVL
jgi:hypothetical protein